jgi:hypothetical protein
LDKRHLSHDILNLLERLRIMHDLARDENYQHISKNELKADLLESMKELAEKFDLMLQ